MREQHTARLNRALCTVGDMMCFADRVVTPAGVLPLAGSAWHAVEVTWTESRVPGYALVLTILLFPFGMLGLLCLLIREHITSGHVHVAVAVGGVVHAAAVPVSHRRDVDRVMGQVAYARRLSAWARARASA